MNLLLGYFRDYWGTLLPFVVIQFVARPIFKRLRARMRLADEQERQRRNDLEKSAEYRRAADSYSSMHAD